MNRDTTDFDVLLAGASPEEAKRLWRSLAEWCDGDENSFPVLLAMLTRAEWRAAGRIPMLVNESVKLMDLKFADQRQQTGALVKDFAKTVDIKAKDLEGIVATHTATVNQAVAKAQMRLNDAESVARNIKGQLESGATEFNKARSDFEAERQKFETVRKQMEKKLNRNELMWVILIVFGLIGLGMGAGIAIARPNPARLPTTVTQHASPG